jgi:hypothetical protein
MYKIAKSCIKYKYIYLIALFWVNFGAQCNNNSNKINNEKQIELVLKNSSIDGNHYTFLGEVKVPYNLRSELFLSTSKQNLIIIIKDNTQAFKEYIQITPETFTNTNENLTITYYFTLKYLVTAQEKEDKKDIEIKISVVNSSYDEIKSTTALIDLGIEEIMETSDLSMQERQYIKEKYQEIGEKRKQELKGQLQELKSIRSKVIDELKKEELIILAKRTKNQSENFLKAINTVLKTEAIMPNIVIDKLKYRKAEIEEKINLLDALIKWLNADSATLEKNEKELEKLMKTQITLENLQEEIKDTIRYIIKSSLVAIVLALVITPFILH